MGSKHMVILSCFVFLATLHGIQAVKYNFIDNDKNSPGSHRFSKEISIVYTKRQMDTATNFIWSLFQQNTSAERKPFQDVTLELQKMGGVAHASGNKIQVSTNYIEKFPGNVKMEFTGLLFHEMTHVWQWDGNGHAPGGLIEGIADYVRLKAKLAPSHWVKPGGGKRWDEGYDVTARFLEYCTSLSNGFIAELNKMMKSGYTPDYFKNLLGKTVDQLWADYKAKYP